MIKSLIGCTGFVGSNLVKQINFNFLYNSSNISEINGREFDLLIIAAPSAVKWKANQEPEKDLEMINDLINSLKKVKAKQVVQISTIDIYKNPINVDENTIVEMEGLHPYGKNRFHLEEFIRQQFKNHLIVRLPALFGNSLKKNFIYDILNPIPTMLTEDKFNELSKKNSLISKYFIKQENNSYLCKDITEIEKMSLEKCFKDIGFTSLNFTDNRSIFQFYCLNNLWKDINIALQNKISLLNISTEPISAKEIAQRTIDLDFNNKTEKPPVNYNIKSINSNLWGSNSGYLYSKESILKELKRFIKINNK